MTGEIVGRQKEYAEIAGEGQRQVVRLLLERGAKLSWPVPGNPARSYRPLLEVAVETVPGHGAKPADLEIIQMLLDHGAPLEGRDSQLGEPALQAACINGTLEAVKKLLDAGANPNPKCDDLIMNPLYRAAFDGRWNVVHLLRSRGAEEGLFVGKIIPDLHRAATLGEEQRVKGLLNGRDISSRDPEGRTTLFWAVHGSHVSTVRLLLENGADPNLQPPGNIDLGGTPLHEAAARGSMEMAELLVDHCAMLDAGKAEDTGLTPAFIGVVGGHFDVLRFLVEKGANVNVVSQGWYDSSMLHVAALHGRFEIAKFLLEHDAKVNAKDDEGNTPCTMRFPKGICT
jgi:ankyrin repeat protein